MSIYSGFPTREDEKNYNKLLVKLITTLQSHVLQLTCGLISPEMANKYTRIISKMQTYEEHKYLPPKFTELLAPLQQGMSMKRAVHTEHSNPDSKLQPLEEVKEEQEELLSSRKIKSTAAESYMKGRKSLSRYRRFPPTTTKPVLTQKSVENESKQGNKVRSFSLFGSETQKSKHLQSSKESVISNNYLSQNEVKMPKFQRNQFSHMRYASTSKRLPKNKTAEGPRINHTLFDDDKEIATGKTMDQIMKYRSQLNN